MKPFSFPIFLCFLALNCLFAQNEKKADSLINAYKNQAEDTLKVSTIAALYNHFLYQDHKLAKQYADEELKLSKKLNYDEGIGTSLYHLGIYYNNIDEIDSAKYYYDASLKVFEKLNKQSSIANVNHGFAILEYSLGNFDSALDILDKNLIIYNKPPVDSSSLAVTHVLKGGIYRQLGKYKLAMNEALSALPIYDNLNEDIRRADALGMLAAVEFNLENFSQSIEYNSKALEIYQDNNDHLYSAQAMNDIGNTYYYLKDYPKAEEFLKNSLTLSEKIDSQDLIATSLGNLGKVYTKTDESEKAISNFNKSIEITQKTGNQYKTIESLNDLGIAYNSINRPKKAIPLFDRAIDMGKKIDARQNLRISFFNKSESQTQLKNYREAFDTYKQFTAISDSIFNSEKTKKIEELRTQYETEKKEQQILLQQNEIDILKKKEEIDMLYKVLLGFGLLLSLIGFYALRQKLKRSKAEKEKLNMDLDFKKKELTTHALHLAKKNEVLENLKQQAQEFKTSENSKRGFNKLIRTIDFDLKDDNNWENFSRYFEQVHKDFNTTVKKKFPEVTSNELRLMALLKMNLSSKEIANILNVSPEGIKKARYRLRKKLRITTEDSLQDLVLSL
ncbi:tetratricopeptide repeat protein [Hyunsoonleella rubra]|uniref:Tetratricopeptide repeat protein n=1 Tax=Hyunsoonleella rubra TaxID=1737062 RepID=A0ABW5TD46_9FLAO